MRYPSYKYPIQKINDTLYQIIAEYQIERIKDPQGLKEWLKCDVVFKNLQNGVYLFCRKIDEIEVIEE